MYPCLVVPEIFSLICNEIRWQGFRSGDLASLARTCRAWTEIALDVLWYKIDEIGPLIECMPRDLWEKDEYECVSLRRPLKNSDIQIFNKYARRVRCFSECAESPSTQVYRALSSQSRDPLLPRLEQLRWLAIDGEAFPYIRLFLHPGLKRLTVSFGVYYEDQLSFFRTIPTTFAPNISTLNLSLGFDPVLPNHLTVGGFSDALQAWRGLSDLTLDNIPVECLLCTPEMRNLKKLAIELRTTLLGSSHDLSQLHLSLRPRLEPLFPSLEVLLIKRIYHTGAVIRFLRTFKSAQLSHIELGFNNSHDASDVVRDVLDTLHHSCNTHSLKVFQFSHIVQLPFSAIISPLFGFPALEKVHLDLRYVFGVSEEQMSHIASSWPNLEVLHIAPFAKVPSTSLTTLSSLVPLARGCPKLRELSLIIDASDTITRRMLKATPEKTKRVRNWSLRSLDVGFNSPISQKEFVASFLADIFPNLEDIMSRPAWPNAQQNEHYRQWRYVALVLLPMLTRARRREYSHLGISEPKVLNSVGSFVSGARTTKSLADKVEEEDGDWSDPELLLHK